MNPLIQFKTIPPLLITVAWLLVCSGILPEVQAVVPPPDGGYPNFTTAEGTTALQSLTFGAATRRLVGFRSLATQSAASTQVLALGRSFSTSATKLQAREQKIRPLVQRRFYSTAPA